MAKTTFYQRNYVGWPAVKIKDYTDPDSKHWENRAQDIKHWLILKMGEDEFLEWADRLFPDDTIEQATYKEIFELYEAQFRICQTKEREECSCLPDLPDGRINGGRGHVCPVCAEENRTKDLPF